ncbi:MAG: FAD-dependent oxidoreductase [Acidobacteriota bacterium]|nr:MAG: FAD-dependent oxidoreductase [Acidobacteriota bacterium]
MIRTGLLRSLRGLLFIGLLVGWACSSQPPALYDIVIYGGTSAAVTAAVEGVRQGKSVIVVCPELHLGGMTSGGLGWTDTGNKAVIGGLAREFYHRIWRHYHKPEAWKWQSQAEYGNRGQGTPAIDGAQRTMWIFEPHVAEQVFEDLISEHAVPVVRNRWLDRQSGVKSEGGRIISITTTSGETYRGKVFIDASYEGDLMAAAGVSYHVGRESSATYGERWNGIQKAARHHRHFFAYPTDPYRIPGDPSSGLLPRISSESPGEDGAGDHRIQAYCFRMCLTRVTANRIPFPKPEGYDPAEYELLLRVFESGWRETFDKFDPIPNLKTDTNNHGPFSTDNIGRNYGYPEGSYEERRAIVEEHERYQKGWLYFIANDPRVPAEVRETMAEWGLAADEFQDNGGWPYQIYVRKARRMLGTYVMTEQDTLGIRTTPGPIGMGSYTMDSHNVQRYVTPEGYVQNEGDIGVHPEDPYLIAYGSVITKAEEFSNLLVPICLSSSHIAYGSIRMEPVFMILGQSCATAAAIAIEQDIPVQQVSYAELRKKLLESNQVLEMAIPENDSEGVE